MSTPLKYLSKAPVREALIDIRFEPFVDIEKIRKFSSENSHRFDEELDLYESTLKVRLDRLDSEPESRSTCAGKRLNRENPPYVMQCRVNGFTFSRLSPYGEWDEFQKETLEWWQKFSEAVEIQTVSRLAVRYINDLRLPPTFSDFEEYLTAAPLIPANLPQGLAGFLQKVVCPDLDEKTIAVVTQSFEPPPPSNPPPEFISVLLDIDVFVKERLNASDLSAITSVLNGLREKKNKLFFGYLTDKAVELFK